MPTARRPICLPCVLVICLSFVFSGVTASEGGAPTNEARFEARWVLVRLSDPLSDPQPDGSFSLTTGREHLDAAIERLGIRHIELALTSVSRSPRDPAALARYGLDRIYKFHVPPGVEILAVVDEIAGVPGVAHAEPDHVAVLHPADVGSSRSGAGGGAATDSIPDDPRFPDQWGLHNTGQTGGEIDADIDAPEAWDHNVGGAALIAFIDSGVDTDHEDLVNKLELDDAWNFIDDNADIEDDTGHGTWHSSVAAADTNNGIGVAGTCWGCRILPLKAFGTGGTGNDSTVADAIVWSTDHGVRILNMSQWLLEGSDLLLRAVAYAADAGVIQTAAVGNEFGSIAYPARARETIAVGYTEGDDELGFFSNRGPEVDLVAPGVDILGAQMGGGYSAINGSNMATAFASGAAAIIASVDPSVGREEARHLLRSGADDEVGLPGQDTPGFDIYHGWGRLNLDRTVRGALSAPSLRVEGKSETRLYLNTPNPIAESYDFVRGALGQLRETRIGVELGQVVCLENDSADPDTSGNEDGATPSPGDAFFYVARFNGPPGAGSYGGSTQNRDRGVLLPPDWESFGGQADAYFGFAANTAGDVNNDGYDDVVVGAHSRDGVFVDGGRAEVYLGGPSGLATSPVWAVEGDTAGDGFGIAVGSAGDVNGDGYDDILIGAYLRDETFVDEGRVYLYHGSESGPEAAPAWTVDGDQASVNLGLALNGAGDVNGDGYDDVILGAHRYDITPGNDEGRVWVYHGSATGLQSTAAWTMDGDQVDGRFGRSVDGAGDVNADGYDDVVIGSHLYDAPEVDEGRVWVYLGGPGGLAGVPVAELEIDVAGARFNRVHGAGDVDADGYDDIVVGANRYSNGETEEGAAFLYRGSSTGVETSYSWSFESNQAYAQLGRPDGAGDVNGDGIADVAVGARWYEGTRHSEGRVWVFEGSSSGLSSEPDWSATGMYTDGRFGLPATTAGDVDGDGVADLLIGANGHSEDHPHEGRLVLYYGPLPENTDCPR